MNDTIDMLRRASAYIQATVTTDPETGDPATDCDIAANDLACELACEADRLGRQMQAGAAHKNGSALGGDTLDIWWQPQGERLTISPTAAWPFPPNGHDIQGA